MGEGRREILPIDFQGFFDISDRIMCLMDRSGDLLHINPAFMKILGYKSREVIERSFFDFIHPEDRQATDEHFQKLDGKKKIRFEHRYRGRSGYYHRLHWTVLYNHGRGIICATAGSAELREIETIEANEHRLETIINTISDGLLVVDKKGRIRFVNPATESIFGKSAAELIGREFGIPFIDDKITEIEIPNPKNGLSVVEMRSSEINWPHRTSHLISLRDITDRKRVERELEYQASHDPLTKLPNRVLFFERLTRSIENSRKNPDRRFAVLFLDLDDFKLINDSLGHLMGDELLKIFTDKLLSHLDKDDILVRLGGDEFSILIDRIEDIEVASRLARKILKSFRQPLDLEGRAVFINASIGIAFSDSEYHHPQEILRDADTAMYQAKARGKGCYAVFDRQMHHRVVERLQLDLELRQGLQREQFILYYQPIVLLETERIDAFEALIRWRHPKKGIISPLNFIPLAEETGLIVPIGYQILRKACQQLKVWQEKFDNLRNTRINVNLSGKQLKDKNLLTNIAKILDETRLTPSCLNLEITESLLIEDIEIATEILLRIRKMGIGLCLDDFGTGYSSLSYLHRLPFDTVKIDRSFIGEISVQNDNSAIVKAIISMARSLGMDVTAEGIETRFQLERLRTLNCEKGQGYLFSRPLSAEESEVFFTGQ